MSLHERIEKRLGWKPGQAKSFSLQALRDLVRYDDPDLANDISHAISSGGYLGNLVEERLPRNILTDLTYLLANSFNRSQGRRGKNRAKDESFQSEAATLVHRFEDEISKLQARGETNSKIAKKVMTLAGIPL